MEEVLAYQGWTKMLTMTEYIQTKKHEHYRICIAYGFVKIINLAVLNYVVFMYGNNSGPKRAHKEALQN